MPSLLFGERVVADELMIIGLVLRFRLFTKLTPFQSWNDNPPREVVQVQRAAVSGLEDRADSQFPHPVSMRIKRRSQLSHNKNGGLAARILGFR